MDDTHCWKVAAHDAVETSHRHTMTLTAPAQGSEPVPANTAKEELHAALVARHTKIILVAGQHTSQPLTRFGDWTVQAPSQ